MTGPISPHYNLSTLPIGIIIRYPGKFVLHFWACVSMRHRYINVDVPNVHTHVSAVHSMSDAVSLVIVSHGFAITNVVQRGEIHIIHFSGWLLWHRFCICPF